MSEQAQSISLQRQLVRSSVLSSVFAGLLAMLLLLGILVYQNMQMHDNMMDQVADLLLVNDLSSNMGSELDDLSEEFDIQYALLLNGSILLESEEPFILAGQNRWVLYQSGHYSFFWSGGQLFRGYVEEKQGLLVRMYQPMHVRLERLGESLLGYGLVLLLVWGLQGLLVHFFIRRQFRSIHQLSKEISQKSVNNLTPLQAPQPQLQELQPIVHQVNRMMQRLSQAITAEQRFTSDASHELRSPLSAIQMRLQLLRRKYGNEQPDLAHDLEQIQKDVLRGSNVLENLLLLARLDPSNDRSLIKTELNLSEVMQEVLAAMQPFLLEKNMELKLQLEPAFCMGSIELLFSCLRNVLDNAIRYSASRQQIHIRVGAQDKQVICVMANEGQGMGDDVLARLGERFYRELGSKTQGSGLGLSICKKIIELHQGQIHFSHAELGGLQVEIRLPHHPVHVLKGLNL